MHDTPPSAPDLKRLSARVRVGYRCETCGGQRAEEHSEAYAPVAPICCGVHMRRTVEVKG